ncbi:hypothetical protein FJT64_019411 [Amphibalanus amphitrite]|uniref:Fibrinogen C-terminal domain-containing protein n=1 Tax=Amphibalanus amphitrite TaxID=1232801 RepID=A0A6A4X4Z8_AMPAM|nr:hypothetical protein FJT64_019411 [Amphibalanus amphitrite]
MEPWCGALAVLSALAVAVSSDYPPPSAAAQLTELLGPVVKEAVGRALDAREAAQAGRSLTRLERRLDDVLEEMAALRSAVTALQGQPVVSTAAPDSEPACERSPRPIPAGQAPHQRPEVLACARSCLQLRDQGGAPQDGVYWFTGMPVPVLCDFSHDGGGWTLLLTAVSRDGWDLLSVLQRNDRSPSLTDNYSILQLGDAIRDLGNGTRFAYRIEAQAETGRQRWGGIWFAPRQYSFVDETGDQTQIRLVRKFDSWDYEDSGIEKRMPWLRALDEFTVLTTTGTARGGRWGTLVLNKVQGSDYKHAPWISSGARHSGTVLYWMRENQL